MKVHGYHGNPRIKISHNTLQDHIPSSTFPTKSFLPNPWTEKPYGAQTKLLTKKVFLFNFLSLRAHGYAQKLNLITSFSRIKLPQYLGTSCPNFMEIGLEEGSLGSFKLTLYNLATLGHVWTSVANQNLIWI